MSYPQLLHGRSRIELAGGVVVGVCLFLILTPLITQGVLALGWAFSTGSTWPAYTAARTGFQQPIGMLAANLGLTALIPISCALMLGLHNVAPGYLASVAGRIRWRYLGSCLAIAALGLGIIVAVTAALTPTPIRPQPGFVIFLVVILLTSPLQAAAEEAFFRGYLTQALGGLVSTPLFGVLVSGSVFALFHGGQNLPLFLDRLAFGLLAALLVWKTGGLEAGIAAHIVNNLYAYLIAATTGSIAQLRGTNQITWFTGLIDIGGFALVAAAAWALARHRHVPTETTNPSAANAGLRKTTK